MLAKELGGKHAKNIIFKISIKTLILYENQNLTTVFFLAKGLYFLDLLSSNPTKWSNTLKHLVGKLPTNCLSAFDHFVGLAF